MPMYARKCTACSHTFEAYSRMSEVDLIECPRCEHATEPDYAAQGPPRIPDHTLVGGRTRCLEIAAAPHEVGTLRRLFGESGAGHCWQDDGTVRFQHRDEARRFFTRDEAIRAEFAEKKAAGLPVPTYRKRGAQNHPRG